MKSGKWLSEKWSSRKTLSEVRKERFAEDQRKKREQRESYDNAKDDNAKEQVENADTKKPEVQGDAEVVETPKAADNDSEKEGVSPENGAKDAVVERYAHATLRLQDTLKQQWKNHEEVRGEIDTRLYAHLQQNTEVDLKDFVELRKMLDGISLISKETNVAWDFLSCSDEQLEVVSYYLQAKHAFDKAMDTKMEEEREKLNKGNSEGAVEVALEALLAYENSLMAEEIRLRKNVEDDIGTLEKLKAGWRWLGDRNLTTLLSEKKGWQPKNTFLSKVGYGALRAMSLRTAVMASLVPVAGLGFGVAGASVALGMKRAFGALAGGSGGHALAKMWFSKDLKRRVGELSGLKKLKEKDYETAIELKKEYDAFILQYHPDTADEVREEEEYKQIEKVYCEAIKSFCKDAEGVEVLRTKQSMSETKARNTIKRQKWKLFAAAAGGGAVSAFVAPKVVDAAVGAVGDLLPDGTDAATGDSQNTISQPSENTRPAPTLNKMVEQERSPSSQKRGFRVVLEEDPAPIPAEGGVVNPPPPESNSGDGEDVPDSADTGGEEFLVNEGGVYTVQDGNWLSKIWLDRNGGDPQQMSDVMRALKELQSTEDGVETLKGFGIRSGDVDILYPDDKIDTNAIQGWFDGERSDVVAEVQPSDTQSASDVASGDTDLGTNVALERGEILPDLSLGDDTPLADVSLHIPRGTLSEGDSISRDDISLKGAVDDKIPSEISREGISLESMKDFEQIIHTVTTENTVSDVLKSHELDASNVPQSVLDKQVFEGHDVQLFTTKDGGFAGVAVDGEYFLSEQWGGTSLEMGDGEKLPFTDTLEDLIKTAESLNADAEDVGDHIVVAHTDGTPVLPAIELQQFRPDLFESDQEIVSQIVKRDDTVFIQIENPPQKSFLIETNQKGSLNHDYVQKEFDTIQKTLKKPESIHSARQEVVRKALTSLTVEKPPADTALFHTLTDHLSAKIEHDADLTDRMFSEKGWGDRRMRIAYSEDQKHLEVQEYVNENRGQRYIRPQWKWRSVLVEKILTKK